PPGCQNFPSRHRRRPRHRRLLPKVAPPHAAAAAAVRTSPPSPLPSPPPGPLPPRRCRRCRQDLSPLAVAVAAGRSPSPPHGTLPPRRCHRRRQVVPAAKSSPLPPAPPRSRPAPRRR
ncbi:Os01g0649566, partial [Oryza sativa Japonica Group]